MGIPPLLGRHAEQGHVQDISLVGIDQGNLPSGQFRRDQIFLDGIRMNAIVDLGKVALDQANLRDMYRICGGDYAGKMSLLMDHTACPGNVADPWYTEDFEATWQDVLEGCQGLLKELTARRWGEDG